MRPELPGHQRLPEPQLAFHPNRAQDIHAHPLRGLLDFGPYSRSLVNPIMDPIRVGTLAPHGQGRQLLRFLSELEAAHSPRERKAYLPEWPGFSKVFGLRVVPADGEAAHVEMPADLDARLTAAPKPHHVLADAVSRALRSFGPAGGAYDVLMILLPERWQSGFEGPEDDAFDLRDYIKAQLAMRGLPSQIIREAKGLSYPCRCSVAWRIGIALYSKAGGVPWKLACTDADTAYVGLSYALRPKTANGDRFLTCCSQVFDADGAGLEFIAYETPDYRILGDNPYLSRPEMRRVMARSLALYQQRHAGRVPRRLVVHKTTPLKPHEIEGAFDALGHIATVDLVQIQQDTPWRGLRMDQPPPSSARGGEPARYPLERGTLLALGGTNALLWTAGNAPEAVNGRNYFKEGKGVPAPLMLARHAGHGGWQDTAAAVLGLTKVNWNNDALYDRMPVTLGFASALAKTIVHMPALGPNPYPVRFFM